ncbi:putative tail length tape measure protein, partial [Escherichia coli 90.2281]
TAS